MGAALIVIFRVLPQSRAQGLGELGPPHFPGCRPAWYNPKLYYLYTVVLLYPQSKSHIYKQTNKQEYSKIFKFFHI